MTAAIGLYGAATWCAGDGRPRPSLLPAMLRRRTSPLTRAVAWTLERLAADFGADVARAALVHASALGEIDVTVGLLHMMREGDGALSPTRFHNSVHNTATGYVSIATGNRGFATAVAAGAATVAAGLWEAAGLIAAGREQVLLVLADEPPPAPLAPGDTPPYDALCVALRLGPTADAPARLAIPARGVCPPLSVPPEMARNPCAPAWALARAFLAGEPVTVPAELPPTGTPPHTVWLTTLTPSP